MSARPVFPQLYALIGEAADLLPADVAARIETLLDDPKDLLPALLARMDGRDGRRRPATGSAGPQPLPRRPPWPVSAAPWQA